MIAPVGIALEITPNVPYMGVVFPLWDRYNFYFLMILKEMLIFLSLSNPVLQYSQTDQHVIAMAYCFNELQV